MKRIRTVIESRPSSGCGWVERSWSRTATEDRPVNDHDADLGDEVYDALESEYDSDVGESGAVRVGGAEWRLRRVD